MLTHGDAFTYEYALPKESGNKGEGMTLTVHLSISLRGDQLEEMGDLEKGYVRCKLDGMLEGTGCSRTSRRTSECQC